MLPQEPSLLVIVNIFKKFDYFSYL